MLVNNSNLFKLIQIITIISFVNSKNSSENYIDCENFDLIGTVPLEEFLTIITNSIRYDPETQNAANFLQSSDFKNLFNRLILSIHNRPLLGFIAGVGLQVANVMDHLTDAITNHSNDTFHVNNLFLSDKENIGVHKRRQGVGGVLKEIVGVLPAEKIKNCFNLRLNTEPAFKHIINQMNTPEFKNTVESLRRNDNYQALTTQLEERGIEFDSWLNEAITFFRSQQN